MSGFEVVLTPEAQSDIVRLCRYALRTSCLNHRS